MRFAPLLQWPDRSGFAPDSLFLPAYSCQHLICSLWNYTDIILPPVTVFVNPLKGFLLFFYQPGLLFTGNVPRGVFCEQSSQKTRESQREIMRMHDFCASRSVLLVTEWTVTNLVLLSRREIACCSLPSQEQKTPQPLWLMQLYTAPSSFAAIYA